MNDYKELITELRNCEKFAASSEIPVTFSMSTENLIRIADTIEQLVAERDAAIKDMQDYQGSFCCYCKRNNTEECLFPDEVLLMCGKFEWRGVQE